MTAQASTTNLRQQARLQAKPALSQPACIMHLPAKGCRTPDLQAYLEYEARHYFVLDHSRNTQSKLKRVKFELGACLDEHER